MVLNADTLAVIASCDRQDQSSGYMQGCNHGSKRQKSKAKKAGHGGFPGYALHEALLASLLSAEATAFEGATKRQ